MASRGTKVRTKPSTKPRKNDFFTKIQPEDFISNGKPAAKPAETTLTFDKAYENLKIQIREEEEAEKRIKQFYEKGWAKTRSKYHTNADDYVKPKKNNKRKVEDEENIVQNNNKRLKKTREQLTTSIKSNGREKQEKIKNKEEKRMKTRSSKRVLNLVTKQLFTSLEETDMETKIDESMKNTQKLQDEENLQINNKKRKKGDKNKINKSKEGMEKQPLSHCNETNLEIEEKSKMRISDAENKKPLQHVVETKLEEIAEICKAQSYIDFNYIIHTCGQISDSDD